MRAKAEAISKVDSLDDINRIEDKKKEQILTVSIVLIAASALVYFFCIFYGTVDLSYEDVLDVWFGKGNWGDTYIVETVRMPRIACAAVVGAGLAVAGMAMQALFKNPLASPSTLGVSSGASFGASLAIAFGIGAAAQSFNVSLMAFVFCFITILLVYGLATTRHGTPTVLLLLAGVAVGAFFSGLTSFIQYVVDPDTLQSIVYWTMGSFSKCGWTAFKIGLVTVGIGIALIASCIREMNLISLGEEQAKSLGVNITRVRMIILVGTALTVGGCVSISGTIGFVGLIIPHIFRSLCGPNHKYLIVLCILGGAIFMMLVDLASRLTDGIPVGIITSLIGAPFFVYILRKKKTDFW